MEIKKILSGVVAGALAVSTLASMSITSSAKETTKTFFDSTIEGAAPFALDQINETTGVNKAFSNTLVVCDGVGGDNETVGSKGVQNPLYWAEGAKLTINYEPQATKKKKTQKVANTDTAFQLVGKVTDAWTWTDLATPHCVIKDDVAYACVDGVDPDDLIVDPKDPDYDPDMFVPGVTFNADNTSVTFDLQSTYMTTGNEEMSWLECIQQMKELCVKGQDATITSIAISGDYEAPAFNEWVDNGDYTYTWTSNQPKMEYDGNEEYFDGMTFQFTKDMLPITDYANVASVSVDVYHNDYATVTLGAKQASDGEWAKNSLALKGDAGTETLTFEPEGGLVDGEEPAFGCNFMNANVILKISNIKVTMNDGTVIVPGKTESSEVESSEVESSEVESSEVESSAVESSEADSSSKKDSSSDYELPPMPVIDGDCYWQFKTTDKGVVRFVFILHYDDLMRTDINSEYTGIYFMTNDFDNLVCTQQIKKAYRSIIVNGKQKPATDRYKDGLWVVAEPFTGYKSGDAVRCDLQLNIYPSSFCSGAFYAE